MTVSRKATQLLLVTLLPALFSLGACGDDAEDDATTNTEDSGSEAGEDAGAEPDASAASDDGGDDGDASDEGEDELGGGSCEEGACDFECTGACEVECLGTSCTAACPEGDCALDADFEAVAAFDCEGGRCAIDCDGASDCTINCDGGGCIVGCDGDSRCNVSCPEDAPACEVFCEAGSLASCDNDNCEISGCEECDKDDLDESYAPSLDPADYSATIDNPYLPLRVRAKWEYEAPDERITIEVLDETYTTATGVECAVVYDVVTDLDGVLIEETWDWFAQDAEGNVWYFGEDTAEYVNGQQVNTRGSWEAGVDGALPGIVAHAVTPDVGTVYKQEYYRCEAEDLGEILATGESVEVPAGDYEDCIRIHDFSAIEPHANEHKLFCPGVGVALVYELEPGENSGGEAVETLVSVEIPE